MRLLLVGGAARDRLDHNGGTSIAGEPRGRRRPRNPRRRPSARTPWQAQQVLSGRCSRRSRGAADEVRDRARSPPPQPRGAAEERTFEGSGRGIARRRFASRLKRYETSRRGCDSCATSPTTPSTAIAASGHARRAVAMWRCALLLGRRDAAAVGAEGRRDRRALNAAVRAVAPPPHDDRIRHAGPLAGSFRQRKLGVTTFHARAAAAAPADGV